MIIGCANYQKKFLAQGYEQQKARKMMKKLKADEANNLGFVD